MELNLKRLFLLLKRMCLIYSRNLLYLFVVLLAIGILTPDIFGRTSLICIYSFILLIILAQFSFREYKTKQGRTAILLLPASTLEKYIAEILFIMIIYPLVLGAASIIGLMIGDLIFSDTNTLTDNLSFMIKQIFGYDNLTFNFLLFGFAFSFALLFGSLFFKRFSAIKIFIIFCTIITGMTVCSLDVYTSAGLQYCKSNFGQEYLNTFYNTLDVYMSWACGISAIFFVVLTYFRLKEERVL